MPALSSSPEARSAVLEDVWSTPAQDLYVPKEASRTRTPHIPQAAQKNNREWFQKNKQRYEDEVREPLLCFVTAFAPRLEKISPHFVAEA